MAVIIARLESFSRFCISQSGLVAVTRDITVTTASLALTPEVSSPLSRLRLRPLCPIFRSLSRSRRRRARIHRAGRSRLLDRFGDIAERKTRRLREIFGRGRADSEIFRERLVDIGTPVLIYQTISDEDRASIPITQEGFRSEIRRSKYFQREDFKSVILIEITRSFEKSVALYGRTSLLSK